MGRRRRRARGARGRSPHAPPAPPRALTFAPGEGSLWAWIGTPEQPDLERVAAALAVVLLRDGAGIALATPGEGLEGFRLGHQEALHARRIAELGAATGVVRYDEVEAVSLMSVDLDRLERFVERTLGELAAPDEATARLRETLLAWLVEGGNARRAAERVHAHKNTVLYRLGRAQQILGRPLDADRGELELALTAMQHIGPRRADDDRFVRASQPGARIRLRARTQACARRPIVARTEARPTRRGRLRFPLRRR